MKIPVLLVALAVLAAPVRAGKGLGIEIGGGFASLFTSQHHLDDPNGFAVWAAKDLGRHLALRFAFVRAGIARQYVGVFPMGGLLPPQFEPVSEWIERGGSIRQFDLVLSRRIPLCPRLYAEMGAGLGLTLIYVTWSGDATGYSSGNNAHRPHLVFAVGLGAQPLARCPVGVRVGATVREVPGVIPTATDTFEPFGSGFSVRELNAAVRWRF